MERRIFTPSNKQTIKLNTMKTLQPLFALILVFALQSFNAIGGETPRPLSFDSLRVVAQDTEQVSAEEAKSMITDSTAAGMESSFDERDEQPQLPLEGLIPVEEELEVIRTAVPFVIEGRASRRL